MTHNANKEYINSQIFQLFSHDDDNKDVEMPLVYDGGLYLFEVHMDIYDVVRGRRVLRYTFHDQPLTPQILLYQYLQRDCSDTVVAAYQQTCRMLSLSEDSTAVCLANMVTPNLQNDIWINANDVHLAGLLIVPVILTVADMRRLVASCASPQFSSTSVTNAKEFCETVSHCPRIFDFVPYLDASRLDNGRVYVTRSIKYCHPVVVNSDESTTTHTSSLRIR